MSVQTFNPTSTSVKAVDQVRKRDEQIRRVLNAAQYKKYKETEKELRNAIQKEDSIPVRAEAKSPK